MNCSMQPAAVVGLDAEEAGGGQESAMRYTTVNMNRGLMPGCGSSLLLVVGSGTSVPSGDGHQVTVIR